MREEDTTSLYLVPTPIGNLGDITLRALEVLKSVNVILAEDTRTSGILFKHYSISKPLQSFHNFNEHKILNSLIQRMEKGETMALVTDAGTPGISDPGFLLVRACLEASLKIECLPGATAFVPALVKYGLPSDRFALLKKLSEEDRTIIFYESPHRLLKTLEQLKVYFEAERKASVSRELTKKFEQTINGTLDEIIKHFTSHPPKGEVVIVVDGKKS
jgi:16S rRNA (cytidine1402-2'-O)-methyltransferase